MSSYSQVRVNQNAYAVPILTVNRKQTFAHDFIVTRPLNYNINSVDKYSSRPLSCRSGSAKAHRTIRGVATLYLGFLYDTSGRTF